MKTGIICIDLNKINLKLNLHLLHFKANELSIIAGIDVCVMVKDSHKLDYFFTKGDVLEEKIKNNLKNLF